LGAKQQLDRASQIKPPVRKRFVISDATPEARLEILCENPNGVLLLRDELDGHIAQLKKDGYENARAQELQFFDGHQDYSDDRIKRGSHIAEGPRMALYGNLQPAKVEKYLMEMHKGGSDDGYIQRMLQLAVQPTISEEFELLDIRPSLEAEGATRDLFKAAQAMRLDRNSLTQRIMPKVLKFDPDAQVEFDQFFVALENKLRSGGISNPVIAAHFGKYRGTLPKLALVMALAIDPFATSISLEAFRKAVSLLLFYREHAIRIYGVVTRGDLSSAYELLERIKKGQLNDGFNPRDDIQRKEWQGLRTSSEIDAAIDLLVKHNHLRVIAEGTNGRPKRTVQIHPNLIRQKGTKVVT
jgi:putative DNA primase/helicase